METSPIIEKTNNLLEEPKTLSRKIYLKKLKETRCPILKKRVRKMLLFTWYHGDKDFVMKFT